MLTHQQKDGHIFLNSDCWGWSPNTSNWHVGHRLAYCTCPGWLWEWRVWWNNDWQGKPKYWEKACTSATFLTGIVGGGVQLGPLGTAATSRPIVPAPDDYDDKTWWNDDWKGKPKYLEKTCPSAALFTTNPTWPDWAQTRGAKVGS
jgi:hypothetical protein